MSVSSSECQELMSSLNRNLATTTNSPVRCVGGMRACRLHILETALPTELHYKIQLTTQLPSTDQLWSAISSDASCTPSFSSEGYPVTLASSHSTHIHVTLFQCESKNGEYTPTGSTTLPIHHHNFNTPLPPKQRTKMKNR